MLNQCRISDSLKTFRRTKREKDIVTLRVPIFQERDKRKRRKMDTKVVESRDREKRKKERERERERESVCEFVCVCVCLCVKERGQHSTVKQFKAESFNMVCIRMRELENNPLKTKLVAKESATIID